MPDVLRVHGDLFVAAWLTFWFVASVCWRVYCERKDQR